MINRDIEVGGSNGGGGDVITHESEYERKYKQRQRERRNEKYFKIVVLVVMACIIIWGVRVANRKAHPAPPKQYQIEGVVRSKFIVPGGRCTDAAGYITFYSDSLDRNITTPLSWNSWGSIDKDSSIVIPLTKDDLGI